ncbi:MAG TPA: EAL domain-containing protein, partial [Steroidobacteraceae bacterium]|nr:EAL domain-containing protein [Steroidobacteraceae bacterium]
REARRRLLAERLPDTLLRIDAQGTIKEVLAVGTSGIGLALDARGEGRRLDDLLPAPTGTSFAALCTAAIDGRHPVERELVRSDGDGITTIDFRLVPFGPGRGLVILRDLTERQLAASYDPRGALFYDSLTGLPTRALFMSRLREVLADGPPPDSSVAIIRLQLDQFKKVDQSLGPTTADELLAEMGRRLIGLVEGGSPADSTGEGSLVMAARLEPDAFALLAVSLSDRSACTTLAERIRQPLSEPVLLDGRQLRSTVSIGISLWPENGADGETLMRNAAMAANHARADGTARLYTDTLRMRSLRGLDIEQHLRRALEGDELCLHYQPKVDVGRGQLIGFEALLRWEPLELGRLSPAEIIPVAEQSGLIGALGEWVLRRACADAPSFQDPTVGPISTAVNVSAGQFDSGDLAAMTRTIVESAAIKPELIELELTESVLMNDSARAFRTFGELRALGIRLAIDDFGTGYSSLQYLRRLPIDALKIDGSFVTDIAHDTGAYAICSAVIALGHSLGLEVIAEGVETAAQAQALKARGCNSMQGYLFGRPMPGADVAAWIRRGDWRRAIGRAEQPVSTDY